MSKYFQTGDVTLDTEDSVRIYVHTRDVSGYFFFRISPDRQFMFVSVPFEDSALLREDSEPVCTTMADVVEAIRATYGN